MLTIASTFGPTAGVTTGLVTGATTGVVTGGAGGTCPFVWATPLLAAQASTSIDNSTALDGVLFHHRSLPGNRLE